MRLVLPMLLAMAVACSTTKAASPEKRTLPSPLVAAKLPERPDAEVIPSAASWVISAEEGEIVPEGRSGILMSQEKAMRAARYVVSYDELRRLYEVDLNTWGREREIYERYLIASEAETKRAWTAAERSWWERNAPHIALIGGFVVGAVLTASIVAAVQGTENLVGSP